MVREKEGMESIRFRLNTYLLNEQSLHGLITVARPTIEDPTLHYAKIMRDWILKYIEL